MGNSSYVLHKSVVILPCLEIILFTTIPNYVMQILVILSKMMNGADIILEAPIVTTIYLCHCIPQRK